MPGGADGQELAASAARPDGGARSGRSIPALTGLRIVAALAVYLSHLGPPHSAPSVLVSFFSSGYMGVTVFFVLSGFVLSINYFGSFTSPNVHKLWDYVVARFARIYPLYIAVLVYIIVRLHAYGEAIGGWWQHVLAIQAWSPTLAQAYNFNGPAWSVSVEVFLYACFPLLVVLLGRLDTTRALGIVAGVVVLCMVGLTWWFVATGRGDLPWTDPESAHRWLYRTPLTRLGDFTLGILAARLFVRNQTHRAWKRAGYPLAAGGGIVVLALMAWSPDVFSAWSWDVLYALPAALVILGLALSPGSLPARFLSLPVMVLLGESSYAFYLVHQPALEYLGANRWSIATSPTTVIFEIFIFGIIVCLSVGLHVVLENPARRFIRRIATSSVGKGEREPWHGPREAVP
jgi:peptidoglycan/LPS O-acetylase OafA/YrhL